MKPISSWKDGDTDLDLLRRCKQAVERVATDATVVLYGSRARGNANKDSDYDILVIVDRPVDMNLKKQILSNVYPLELETGAVLTLIVYSRQKWNSPLYRAMPFHKNVQNWALTCI